MYKYFDSLLNDMNLCIRKAVNTEEITSNSSVCSLPVLTLTHIERTNHYLGWFTSSYTNTQNQLTIILVGLCFETASCEALLVLIIQFRRASSSILLPQLLEWQDLFRPMPCLHT